MINSNSKKEIEKEGQYCLNISCSEYFTASNDNSTVYCPNCKAAQSNIPLEKRLRAENIRKNPCDWEQDGDRIYCNSCGYVSHDSGNLWKPLGGSGGYRQHYCGCH